MYAVFGHDGTEPFYMGRDPPQAQAAGHHGERRGVTRRLCSEGATERRRARILRPAKIPRDRAPGDTQEYRVEGPVMIFSQHDRHRPG